MLHRRELHLEMHRKLVAAAAGIGFEHAQEQADSQGDGANALRQRVWDGAVPPGVFWANFNGRRSTMSAPFSVAEEDEGDENIVAEGLSSSVFDVLFLDESDTSTLGASFVVKPSSQWMCDSCNKYNADALTACEFCTAVRKEQTACVFELDITWQQIPARWSGKGWQVLSGVELVPQQSLRAPTETVVEELLVHVKVGSCS